MLEQYFGLRGRVALITGGSRGLGRAMARGLAQAGADIVISARRAEELLDAAQDIGRSGVRVHTVVADMTQRDQVERLAREAINAFGRVDILVNNAGSNTPQHLEQIQDEVWDQLVELNLRSVMALSRALVPHMKARRWGRIIHIASIMAFISKEGRSAYSATKAALMGLARATALELGPFGITVNCIAPGPFLTELPGKLLSEEEKRQFSQRTALGRWGEPDELIGPVLLLASEAGRYITGTTLVVDGGFLAR
ncbi:MAG: 3-oxoacyl-ACP reductase [Gemmataceae bacterium]